jgi:hypothetical protein
LVGVAFFTGVGVTAGAGVGVIAGVMLVIGEGDSSGVAANPFAGRVARIKASVNKVRFIDHSI